MLCRLFKKNDLKLDENTENSNCEEGEPNDLSPTIVKSPGEDEHSEALAPPPWGQTEAPPLTGESYQTRLSDGAAVINPVPIDSLDSVCTGGESEKPLGITCIPVSRSVDSIKCEIYVSF